MSYTISRPRIIELIELYQAAAVRTRVRYPELLEEIRDLLTRETPDDPVSLALVESWRQEKLCPSD